MVDRENRRTTAFDIQKGFFPASPDFRLATLVRYLGKTPAGAHRAIVDVELLCFVFESAVKELGIRSVQSLLAIAKSYRLEVVQD